jgi:hypothetical protein
MILFGDSEVNDEDGMSVVTEAHQDVLRLDISVDVTVVVYTL